MMMLYSFQAQQAQGKLHLVFISSADGLTRDENGLIISMEERPSKLVRNSRTFGLELQPYLDKKMLEIIYLSPVFFSPDEEALILEKENKRKQY